MHIPARPGEPESTFADISRIQDELGWIPTYSIEDGISELLKNIEYWRDAPVWTPSLIRKATKTWFKLLKK